LWKPIDPAELALKVSSVEKDADAEAIFWEVRVSDEVIGGTSGSKMHSRGQYTTQGTTISNYVRIKVFNDRGRQSQSKIEIPYLGSWVVEDIAARTVNSDGRVFELDPANVVERTLIQASGVSVKAKGFVLSGVESGSIVEYRWKERHTGILLDHLRLPFQRDIPVQTVRYYIRPLQYSPYGMRAQTFNGVATPFVKELDGFYSVSMSNVPAFQKEPHMPPEGAVRPWMLVYYTPDENLEGEAFWKEFGKIVYELTRPLMKVNDDVKRAANATIANSVSPEEKIEKLFEFCRVSIKNSDDDAAGLTSELREKLKDNKTPADTLKRRIGTTADINLLFGALALAAGYDVRIAHVGDRSDTFFDKTFPDPYFIRSFQIAVKVADQWRFFSPGVTYAPLGMLRWQEESQQALLSDPREPVWIKTPLSPPERSSVKRSAHLKLSEDGMLEGDVVMEFTGHLAIQQKELDDNVSPKQREDRLRANIKAQLATAEVSNIQVENVTDPIKPFVYSYHVRIRDYAQRTAKRLFLQPAFFQQGVEPVFAASARKYDIYFHYPWSEQDEVSIELPPGFSWDQLDAPQAFTINKISHYRPRVTMEGGRLIFRRSFTFGENNSILFPVDQYERLKLYFDNVYRQDNRAVTIKSVANN
jgi:hypothetical protein